MAQAGAGEVSYGEVSRLVLGRYKCLIPIAEALYDTETYVSSVTHRKQFQLPALQFPLWKWDHLVLTVPIVSHKVQSHWHSGTCPGALIMGPANQTLRRGTSQHTVAAGV